MGDWNAETPATRTAKRGESKGGETKTQYREPYVFTGPKEKIIPKKHSSIFDGYPSGLMINVVGPPKGGKTWLALQEVMTASQKGLDCLYIYNESERNMFDITIEQARNRTGIPTSKMEHIQFMDMSGVILKAAQFNAIDSFMDNYYVKPVERWMRTHNPEIIVVDSLSKVIRTYPAQAFYAVQSFIGHLKNAMERTKKYPVFLLVNQKSGGQRERNDESVLGGYGCVHDMDGNVVVRVHYVDKWMARDTGFRVGSLVHTIQVMEIRNQVYDTDERITDIRDGMIVLGDTLASIYDMKALEESEQVLNKDSSEMNNNWNR